MRTGGAGLRWLMAACVAALLSACSLPGDSKLVPTAGNDDRAPSGSAAVRCLDAGNLARGILAISRDRAELTVVAARAVRSPDAKDSYLIAIRFNGHPSESSGVWTSNSLDLGDDSVRSVDVGAVEVSQWPWSLVTEPKIAATDPGVAAAKNCL